MGKRVVVIASGDTERRSLPHLVAHLATEGIRVIEVLKPPRDRGLDVEMAAKLVKSAWYAPSDNVPPDKFVILADTDGKTPEDVLRPFKDQLRSRLEPKITAIIQFAFAQWHLEAWYFADSVNLRGYLGGALGSVDASKPDEIQNPKLHLKHLLGDRVYTAVVSEEIAKMLDSVTIAQRSPSFSGFLDAVRNGSAVGASPPE